MRDVPLLLKLLSSERCQAVSMLGIEGRLTLCNMGVEAAARGALVAPDRDVRVRVDLVPQVHFLD